MRHGGVEGLVFEIADAVDLPFDDASFDACRVDRVLRHIADPAPAVRYRLPFEMRALIGSRLRECLSKKLLPRHGLACKPQGMDSRKWK